MPSENPPSAESAVLCQVSDLPERQGRGFVLDRPDGKLRLLLIRRGEAIYGYRNSCPHVGVPLDWNADHFMSFDGHYLQCGTHGAMFRIEDGYCILGPCSGQKLRSIPVIVRDGMVMTELPPG